MTLQGDGFQTVDSRYQRLQQWRIHDSAVDGKIVWIGLYNIAISNRRKIWVNGLIQNTAHLGQLILAVQAQLHNIAPQPNKLPAIVSASHQLDSVHWNAQLVSKQY